MLRLAWTFVKIRLLTRERDGSSRCLKGLRNLVGLNDAGMLDCWILINGADDGVGQDYPAYRDAHRQLLQDYVDRFVVHAGTAAPQ